VSIIVANNACLINVACYKGQAQKAATIDSGLEIDAGASFIAGWVLFAFS
jgi:hypothetical protein